MIQLASNTPVRLIAWPHYVGLFLLSFATLLLELSLTRVLAVANWYHFGFLVISTALLGFGAAGVVLSLWSGLRNTSALGRPLAAICLGFGISTVLGYIAMQWIPFQPFQMLSDWSQIGYSLLYYFVLAFPFFFAGLGISLLLARGRREVNRLYAVDLIGAGVGCIAIRAVMPTFGGTGTVMLAGAIGLIGGLAFLGFRFSRLAAVIGTAAIGMVLLGVAGEQALPIHVFQGKYHPLEPVGQQPVLTRWNTFSRVDVYDFPANSSLGWTEQGRSIVIDAGAAGTAIPDLTRGVRRYLAESDTYRPTGLAYLGKTRPKVLIIGSGAGREVLEALAFGAAEITAVEINPLINEIVTKDMPEAWGGLFEQPEVTLVTEDARSYVRRSSERYDAIIAIHAMSDAALASGAASFGETYILTREAFEDYWDHLTPQGRLLITRPTYQLPKLFATIRGLFDHRQLGSPAANLFAFRGVVAPFGHAEFLSGMLIQKVPLDPILIDTLAARLGVGVERSSGEVPEVFYAPGRQPQGMFQTLLTDLATAPAIEPIIASSSELLEPATDDRPFFNRRTSWSGLSPWLFRSVLAAGDRGSIEALPVAEVALLMLLAQAVVAAAVLIILPLVKFNRQGLAIPNRFGILSYFACLGLGFILIEIVLLQRLSLFLGQPVYTLSVVLAGLLVSTGIGSFAADRWRVDSRKMLSRVLLGVVAAIVLTLIVVPPVLKMALGLALGWRIVVSVLLIAPLGILLGVPFPVGLRMIGPESAALVPWAWAVNGFFTVVGSVLAMILGMGLGFNAVLVIAAVGYVGAFAALRVSLAEAPLVRANEWLRDPNRVERRRAATGSFAVGETAAI